MKAGMLSTFIACQWEHRPRAVAQDVRHQLSPRRSWFEPSLDHVGFVVDKDTWGFLRVLRFPLSLIPLTAPHQWAK
jgi:hypothetical protein